MEVAISHHSLLDNSLNATKENHQPKLFHEQFNYHKMEMLHKGFSALFCLKERKNYQTFIRQWSK